MSLILYIICIKCVLVISNYTFYHITAFNTQERLLLSNMVETHKNAYFFNGVTNEASTTMDVVVDSCCTEDFEDTLFKHDVNFVIHTSNVPSSLDNNSTTKQLKKHISQAFFNWDDIILWVENNVKRNTALTKTVIAKTFEHRDIFVLKLSIGKAKKMSVFVVAGEEGRDWLSSAVLLNYIDRTLQTASDPLSLLNYYDMYFVPIFNPDGFVYTKTNNRMWAKNRKIIRPTQQCDNKNVAVGVNIDRNWFSEVTDSKYACNSIFLGSKALSEEETQGLSYILNSIALKLLAFINLRGFGNLITLPQRSKKRLSINHNVVMEIMKHTNAVLKLQFNKSYPVGSRENYFFNLTGTMPDWVKRNLNIPVVFTVYMQHDSFLPNESHILPLTYHLDSLLNISLIISKEIYGPLYNTQKKKASVYILIMISFIWAYIVKFL